jgi:death on curing protein
MRYLALGELLELHRLMLAATGGAGGVLDLGALESAAAQPQLTFDGKDLYPELHEKAASLGYSLVRSHPFVDGNKRVAHAAMEVFLQLNGAAIEATVNEQEELMLGLAADRVSRQQLIDWLASHLVRR